MDTYFFCTSNAFKWGINSKSLSWGSAQATSVCALLLGLLAQNPVQTEYLWMVVLGLSQPSSILAATSQIASLRFSPRVIQKSEFTSKCWCETDHVKSMSCDNSASQIRVSQVTVLHLQPCYTELLPPHSSSSKRCLGREVIAVKLL